MHVLSCVCVTLLCDEAQAAVWNDVVCWLNFTLSISCWLIAVLWMGDNDIFCESWKYLRESWSVLWKSIPQTGVSVAASKIQGPGLILSLFVCVEELYSVNATGIKKKVNKFLVMICNDFSSPSVCVLLVSRLSSVVYDPCLIMSSGYSVCVRVLQFSQKHDQVNHDFMNWWL